MTAAQQKQQDVRIAQTILAQLNGRIFKMFTGCHTFLAIENGLVFLLDTEEFLFEDQLDKVEIVLNPCDTYTMTFFNEVGETVKEFNGVYCDQLQPIFTQVTGLVTSF